MITHLVYVADPGFQYLWPAVDVIKILNRRSKKSEIIVPQIIDYLVSMQNKKPEHISVFLISST